jgi:hypothetical protein
MKFNLTTFCLDFKHYQKAEKLAELKMRPVFFRAKLFEKERELDSMEFVLLFAGRA